MIVLGVTEADSDALDILTSVAASPCTRCTRHVEFIDHMKKVVSERNKTGARGETMIDALHAELRAANTRFPVWTLGRPKQQIPN